MAKTLKLDCSRRFNHFEGCVCVLCSKGIVLLNYSGATKTLKCENDCCNAEYDAALGKYIFQNELKNEPTLGEVLKIRTV